MNKTIIFAAILAAGPVSAQNRANFTLFNGNVESYNTSSISRIDISDNGKVTVNPTEGAPVVYDGNVASLTFLKNTAGSVELINAGGWFEACWVEWKNLDSADNYYVYVAPEGGQYSRLDYQLVRNYGNYGRADIPGLKAGTYRMKVVPVIAGTPAEEMAAETPALEVRSHDRGGFAHFNYPQGVGAYNNDGTLKSGARVVYVTAETAKTVSVDVITNNKGGTTTCTGFQGIIDGYMKGYDSTPIDFRIIGRIAAADMDKFSSSAEGLQIKNNKDGAMNITIEGIGEDATFHGFGMLLRNAVSVEVRNLGLLWFMDDGVSCDTDNSHCWIHNVDFFYGQKGSDSDQAKGDGSLDVKGNSQYMTFSYNHFWDAGKSSLCGLKESGPNWLTYHHNWFDHSDSRHPRIRTMSVHVYNNYYDGVAKYGVGSTLGSDVFVEANYFRNVKTPVLTSRQGSDIINDPDGSGTFSKEDGGSIKMWNNIMRGKYYYRPYSADNLVEFDAWDAPSRDAQMPAEVTAKQGGATYSNWDTNSAQIYAYTPDAPEDVPAIVRGTYGAGRCGHGDFRWTFNNNIQDTNFDVIIELSNAIRDYDSWLVGFYEGSTKIGNGGRGFNNPGGDASEGDECPDGDYNAAIESSPEPDTPITPEDYFIASDDFSYMTFGTDNKDRVEALIADGTLSGGSYKADYTDATYFAGGEGSYQIAKSGGAAIIRCPSIRQFKVKLVRTGSFAGTVETSTDGSTWTQVDTLSGSKGLREFDWSSRVKSDGPVYVRITNTSTGGLNLVGLLVVK